MVDVIVIGTDGETTPYAAAGLRCFEPGPGRMIERVLAERGRCEVLAMTRSAYNALPDALAGALCKSVWPALAIVPAGCDAETAMRVANRLPRVSLGRAPVAA